MNHNKTVALRELIAAELAAEQPGRDPAVTQARLERARAAYEQAREADDGNWDRALISDVTVNGTPVVERPRRRRPRPLSAQERRRRASVNWRQALGR